MHLDPSLDHSTVMVDYDDGWSLEICDVNYRVALDILNKRFNNKLLVFQAHIKEILGLKRLESASAVA